MANFSLMQTPRKENYFSQGMPTTEMDRNVASKSMTMHDAWHFPQSTHGF